MPGRTGASWTGPTTPRPGCAPRRTAWRSAGGGARCGAGARRTGRSACPPSPRRPSETHVALVAALKQLPEAQRQALVLHHIADLPVHEVARETGAPEGTVKARLARGRAALAVLLADEPYDQGASHA